MKTTQLIIFLFVLTASLNSQELNKECLKILYTEYDSIDKVQLIPENALRENYDVLLIDLEYDTIKVTEKKAIDITWPSVNIDGRYYIVITPKQIYLRSGHDNPNPNFLYWINDINREQFEVINEYLRKLNTKTLSDCSIEYSYRQSFFYNRYKKEKFVNDDWSDRQYVNFARIMDLINKPLKKKKQSDLYS